MTVQERFRRQRADAGADPAISVSRPQIGIGGTLAVVAAVLVLLAVALWVPAATMSFAVVAIGLGGIAWRITWLHQRESFGGQAFENLVAA